MHLDPGSKEAARVLPQLPTQRCLAGVVEALAREGGFDHWQAHEGQRSGATCSAPSRRASPRPWQIACDVAEHWPAGRPGRRDDPTKPRRGSWGCCRPSPANSAAILQPQDRAGVEGTATLEFKALTGSMPQAAKPSQAGSWKKPRSSACKLLRMRKVRSRLWRSGEETSTRPVPQSRTHLAGGPSGGRRPPASASLDASTHQSPASRRRGRPSIRLHHDRSDCPCQSHIMEKDPRSLKVYIRAFRNLNADAKIAPKSTPTNLGSWAQG